MVLKAFVWEVVISCGSEVIARHVRSYEREEMIFEPLHYLALLERKTGRREYVQVPPLLETAAQGQDRIAERTPNP